MSCYSSTLPHSHSNATDPMLPDGQACGLIVHRKVLGKPKRTKVLRPRSDAPNLYRRFVPHRLITNVPHHVVSW